MRRRAAASDMHGPGSIDSSGVVQVSLDKIQTAMSDKLK